MINAKDTVIEISQVQIWQIDQLTLMLEQSSFDEDRRMAIKSEISALETGSQVEYEDLYFRLNANQRDRISSGDPYGQNDIKNHLKKLR
jgi:hypothetical protein